MLTFNKAPTSRDYFRRDTLEWESSFLMKSAADKACAAY
jgi:hypothetical protein